MSDDWTAGEPRLLAQRCAAGHRWYLPRVRCPRCGSAEVEAFEPTGAGTVFAATGVHRRVSGEGGAIGIALIDLDEGVRMMARCEPGVAIGTRVHVRIIPDPEAAAEGDGLIPFATPATSDHSGGADAATP